MGWPLWILLASPPHTPLAVGVALLAYPFVVVAAGLAGKVAGILVGHRRHRRLLRQLSRRAPGPLAEAGA